MNVPLPCFVEKFRKLRLWIEFQIHVRVSSVEFSNPMNKFQRPSIVKNIDVAKDENVYYKHIMYIAELTRFLAISSRSSLSTETIRRLETLVRRYSIVSTVVSIAMAVAESVAVTKTVSVTVSKIVV